VIGPPPPVLAFAAPTVARAECTRRIALLARDAGKRDPCIDDKHERADQARHDPLKLPVAIHSRSLQWQEPLGARIETD
jgi:hypothetical protein